MGSVLLQLEREGRKQGEKEARKERSLNISLFFVFAISTYTCFQLHLPDPNSLFKNGPHHPSAGEAGALLEALSTAVPGSLHMFAIQGRQLIQPCSAGLHCSAEGAGNATMTNDMLIM